MKNYVDLTAIQKKYKGSWVALNDKLNIVISYGSDADVVYNKATKKGFKSPTLFKVPKEITPYFGASFV